VGLTRDFLSSDGSISFGDIGLGALDEAEGVEWDFPAENVQQLVLFWSIRDCGRSRPASHKSAQHQPNF